MIIQDIILTVGSAIFIAALLPTVFAPTKPAILTSLITGSTLGVFAVTYFTLDLQYSSITTAISAALWFVIAFQTMRQRRSDQ